MADTLARARAAVSVPALRRPAAGEPLSAFTVDVEDWYQSCVDYDAPITERVVRNTDRILELLDECGVKGDVLRPGPGGRDVPGAGPAGSSRRGTRSSRTATATARCTR